MEGRCGHLEEASLGLVWVLFKDQVSVRVEGGAGCNSESLAGVDVNSVVRCLLGMLPT